MKQLIISSLAVVCVLPQIIQAQTTDNRTYIQRKSFWFEGNFNGTIKKNEADQMTWQYQLDYQYRRGSDANNIVNGQHVNLFKDMSTNVVRPWIHYFPIPGKLRFSVSPLGHWGSWTPRAEGVQKYYHEFRTSFQTTLYQKLGRIEFQQRYRYELRYVGAKDTAVGGIRDVFSKGGEFYSNARKNRLRYLVRANIPVNKSGSSYLAIWNEVFIGLGKNVSNNKILDQNRLVCLFGKKICQDSYPMKIEIGLLWQVQPKYDLSEYKNQNLESNLALNVYWIFDEFHKFKGIKKPKN